VNRHVEEEPGTTRETQTHRHFYTESGMDLDEDIPGLLVGNTTPGERRVLASWARDALTHKAAWSSSQQYEALLAVLERTNELEYHPNVNRTKHSHLRRRAESPEGPATCS
jgi:hypothetical protein